MKKAKTEKDTLRDEYRQSDFPLGLVRGKYAACAQAASNIAVIEPELASAFPNSAAVNDALRVILQVAKQVAIHPQATHLPGQSRKRIEKSTGRRQVGDIQASDLNMPAARVRNRSCLRGILLYHAIICCRPRADKT